MKTKYYAKLSLLTFFLVIVGISLMTCYSSDIELAIFTPDYNPPQVNILTPETGLTVGPTYLVSGTCSDDLKVETVEISIDSENWVEVDSTGIDFATWEFNLEFPNEEISNVYVRARDRFGNYSLIRSVELIVDMTPPTIDILRPYTFPCSTNMVPYTIFLDADDDISGISQIQLTYDNGETWSEFKDYSDEENDYYSFTFDNQGDFDLQVRAIDNVDNEKIYTPGLIHLDPDYPGVVLEIDDGGDGYANIIEALALTASVTTLDAADGYYEWYATNGYWYDEEGTFEIVDNAGIIQLPNLSSFNGQMFVYAYVVDNAGTELAGEDTVIIDNREPEVNVEIEENIYRAISISEAPNVEVTVTSEDVPDGTYDWTALGALNDTGTFTMTGGVGVFTLPDLSGTNGPLQVTVDVEDYAGNPGSYSDSSTVDTTEPIIVSLVIEDGGDELVGRTEAGHLTATITTEDVPNRSYPWTATVSGYPDLGGYVSISNGTGTVYFSNLQAYNGELTLTVTVNDGKGNSASASDTTELDTEKPPAPTVVIDDGGDGYLNIEETTVCSPYPPTDPYQAVSIDIFITGGIEVGDGTYDIKLLGPIFYMDGSFTLDSNGDATFTIPDDCVPTSDCNLACSNPPDCDWGTNGNLNVQVTTYDDAGNPSATYGYDISIVDTMAPFSVNVDLNDDVFDHNHDSESDNNDDNYINLMEAALFYADVSCGSAKNGSFDIEFSISDGTLSGSLPPDAFGVALDANGLGRYPSTDWDLSGITTNPDAEISALVTVYDAAGNEGYSTGDDDSTIDTVMPTITDEYECDIDGNTMNFAEGGQIHNVSNIHYRFSEKLDLTYVLYNMTNINDPSSVFATHYAPQDEVTFILPSNNWITYDIASPGSYNPVVFEVQQIEDMAGNSIDLSRNFYVLVESGLMIWGYDSVICNDVTGGVCSDAADCSGNEVLWIEDTLVMGANNNGDGSEMFIKTGGAVGVDFVYQFETNNTAGTTGPNSLNTIKFRIFNSMNYYKFTYEYGTNAPWTFYIVVSNVATPLASGTFNLSTGTYHTFRIQANSHDFTVWVDNFSTPVTTVNDSTHDLMSSGVQHFITDNSSSINMAFRNFSW